VAAEDHLPPNEDWEEVPGDCPHFPGFEHGKAGCLLCKPKPKPALVQTPTSAGEGVFRRHSASAPVAKPAVWVHAVCGSLDAPRVVAQYDARCPECDGRIYAGEDEIVAL
jgi:hypothetical protein